MLIAIGLALTALERIIPDQDLPLVRGWWARVILLNFTQAGIVILSGFTGEK
ncbi:MAG: hypothetical protein ACJAYU_004934 [Bradymonadia bacterium]|jgi:hypothetical protein